MNYNLIKFSWPKLVYGVLFTVIFYLASLMTRSGCGIDVYCPQTLSHVLSIIAVLLAIYVIILVIQKIRSK